MSTTLDKAKREQHEQLDLGLFDHLLQRMPLLMRVDQVTAAIGWKRSTIYDLCEEGLLHYHALPNRETERKLITRASVALLLLRTASYTAADVLALATLVLPVLPLPQLKALSAAAAQEILRKTR
jgi:predicted DNA-binding transcriptional regulator AlpA